MITYYVKYFKLPSDINESFLKIHGEFDEKTKFRFCSDKPPSLESIFFYRQNFLLTENKIFGMNL